MISISSILYSRLILDLRWVYHSNNGLLKSDLKSSILVFAANVEGNLGAAADASWAIGVNNSEYRHDTTELSENPLSVGLFDPITNNTYTSEV